MAPSKHYFQMKGQTAEELLQQIAHQTFLVDWCYPNPKLPDGKELCDLLVVFDSTVIVWQAKSLKVGKDGNLREKEVDKNLRQLAGARRQLMDLKTPVTLENERRIPERFDPGTITDIFLISVLLGETPNSQSLATRVKSHQCHVFDREFAEIVLNELDTIDDFCGYLREKERVREHVGSLILNGGEKELLGYYLLNGRSLASLEGHAAVFLGESTWDDFRTRPEYREKKQADEVSYVWDELIELTHTGDSCEYERIARELARPSRFDRRCLAKAYEEAYRIAEEKSAANESFRRIVSTDRTTMCFLFVGKGVARGTRLALLEKLCFVARGRVQAISVVVGIATEITALQESAVDYCLLDMPEWGPEEQRAMAKLQEESGTLTQATIRKVEFAEYPESTDDTSNVS